VRNTGKGNLLVVFGEPDIEIRPNAMSLAVNGVAQTLVKPSAATGDTSGWINDLGNLAVGNSPAAAIRRFDHWSSRARKLLERPRSKVPP
jgi:hypothetical protein